MKKNTNSSEVIQVYTSKEIHTAIKKVAGLERLSCSKLMERLALPYIKEYLETYEQKEAAKTTELRRTRGY